MSTHEISIICPNCKCIEDVEVEIQGDPFDPDWITCSEVCPTCLVKWPEDFKREKIEALALELAMEPSSEYDTWDEYRMDHPEHARKESESV